MNTTKIQNCKVCDDELEYSADLSKGLNDGDECYRCVMGHYDIDIIPAMEWVIRERLYDIVHISDCTGETKEFKLMLKKLRKPLKFA